MTKIAIFADTSQDITFEIGKEYGIEVLPYKIQLDEKHYTDQVDIDSREFYEKMEHFEVLKTGIPSIQEVVNRLDKAKEEGYTDVIAFTSSSKLTGMYNLYHTIKHDYEGVNIHVFDTNQVASSVGLLTIYIAELRNQGESISKILEEVERVRDSSNIFALFRTLTYVVKGGRFNKYAGFIGNLLNIHPLLSAVDGEVGVIEKHRGKKRSQDSLVRNCKEYIGDCENYWIAIFSGNNDDEVSELEEKLSDVFSKAKKVLKTELTPVLGCHAGPKSVGISVLKLK